MRKARRFISREKQVFLVSFSLIFLRFPRISKNRLNTSLANERNSAPIIGFQYRKYPSPSFNIVKTGVINESVQSVPTANTETGGKV